MRDFIKKLFKLEGYLISRFWFEGNDVVIHIGRPKKEALCPQGLIPRLRRLKGLAMDSRI